MNTGRSAVTEGLRLHITGVVQGVGFRPFVYGLALRYGLAGWVRNTSSGVDIEVNGPTGALAEFSAALHHELPPLARIDNLEAAACPPNGFTQFEILASRVEAGAFQPISPDISICPDCLRELFDPADRRFRYPFINCTNCGPRFTIIRDIPYDRPLTTMAAFPMCASCSAEYHDPLDRRFHAQPVACSVCGPHVWLEEPGHSEIAAGEDALRTARALLAAGRIVAIKGLGGFHLACDARNAAAVSGLRRRKLRVDKPFAVMLPDIEAARRHCLLNEAEEALLLSRPRPVVIAGRRAESTLVRELAPGQDAVGIMLPYTPLHYLLLEQTPGFPDALVMTSGNLSEEPIAFTNAQAREQLANLADAFLFHDRDIHTRCDDSVMRVARAGNSAVTVPIRRSRGFAPFPVRLPLATRPLLATGAELKNTFCLARDDYAFLSHHIGDMENYETLLAFESGVAHMERLFRIQPEAVVYDLHPDYMASRYALDRASREGLPAIGVQHHHAHIAAGMAEHGLSSDAAVIGVAFDGTGYGEDGAIWGGEFLIAGYGGYQRAARLRYISLPGGDRAVREPWRVALAWLDAAGVPWDDALPPVAHVRGLDRPVTRLDALRRQLSGRVNSPLTSSMGRLFDSAATLAGVRQTVNYEAQAAVEFEASVDPDETVAYPFDVIPGDTGGPHLLIDPSPLWAALVADQRAGLPVGRIAARFHNAVAALTLDVCRRLRQTSGLNEVVLSGGVWQNMTLLRLVFALLEQDHFVVYTHQQVPANDGGLALGQIAIAAHHLSGGPAFVSDGEFSATGR